MTQPLLIEVPESLNPRAPPAPPEGDTPSWFTPLEYFLERERELRGLGLIGGPMDLDPCGHLEAPVSREIARRGGRIYTAEDDGLRAAWSGLRPFINAPFDAPTMAAFLERLQRNMKRGHQGEAVVHCPAWTDRAWWQDFIEPDRRAGRCVVWFERGRMLYGYPGNPSGIGGDTAQFPSALVVWPKT